MEFLLNDLWVVSTLNRHHAQLDEVHAVDLFLIASFQLVCKEMGVSATKILLGVDVSPEAEAIMKLLDADPDVRAAVLALLERLGR